MDKFTDVLVTLQNEGYDFSVFVRKRGESNQGSVSKFSHAYVTPAAKQLLPLNVWDLVEDESVLGQDSQPKDGMLDYRTTKLHLDNLGSLERYLQNAFKHLRQVPCKSIVKVWIKAIEPRKKTKYPYIKGEVTKPNWWPKNVQHREPDHLQKDDRMRLMTSIILAVLPGLKDRMMLDDLYQTTLSLSLFKREPHKNLVLQSVFDISQALCSNDDDRTVDVIDLTQFGARQRDAHFESINKLAATKNVIIQSGKLVSEDACGSLQPGQAIDSPSALSAPMLVDLLIAGDQSILDGFGYSVFEESSTLPLY